MKKGYIISFILGAIIFGSIGVVATTQILSQDVTYGNTNVKAALDTLYTKAKPDYTGDTTVTPTTSSQTLLTNNKILKSNITIGAIPSTYKNLSTATTVIASKLLVGETAYNNLGELITGTANGGVIIENFQIQGGGVHHYEIGFNPKMILFAYSGNKFSFAINIGMLEVIMLVFQLDFLLKIMALNGIVILMKQRHYMLLSNYNNYG